MYESRDAGEYTDRPPARSVLSRQRVQTSLRVGRKGRFQGRRAFHSFSPLGRRWDEGARAVRYGWIVTPSPQPSPLRGEGAQAPCQREGYLRSSMRISSVSWSFVSGFVKNLFVIASAMI